MHLRYLLFQIRQLHDPVRAKEVEVFARALGCPPSQVTAIDLINNPPTTSELAAYDMVLIGGSGDYSVPAGGPWLERALDAMRNLHTLSKPTFASCWGFQALAQAMGGSVLMDPLRTEIGTLTLELSEAGYQDPIFSYLGPTFRAQVGHHDTVDILPDDAIHLARSVRVENHAFRFKDKPIYATQFHPELYSQDMRERLQFYPQYVEKIAGLSVESFLSKLSDSPRANNLLRTFVAHVFAS